MNDNKRCNCSLTGQPTILQYRGDTYQTVKPLSSDTFGPQRCMSINVYFTHGDMGVLLQEFLQKDQLSAVGIASGQKMESDETYLLRTDIER